jgi:2Fe-2S ferredoxin
MMSNNRTIKVTVLCEGKEYILETYVHAYRNLMMLIYDNIYLENFGDCKGIGRCGTCHVQLLHYDDALLTRVANENTTLGKMPIVKTTSRLACHILVDERIDGLVVEIMRDDDLGLY